jgi:hypothetical protein
MGVPARSVVRLRRLAAILDLVDEEIAAVSSILTPDRAAVSNDVKTVIREKNVEPVEIDEFVLGEVESYSAELLEHLRDMARRAGYHASGWDELINVGDETEICLQVCRSTGIEHLREFLDVVKDFNDNQQKSIVLLEKLKDERTEPHLFDRPLLVFSFLRLMTSNEVPTIPSISENIFIRTSELRAEAQKIWNEQS